MQSFDVAIVGGGPAGASCAAFCARAGLCTVVLEREKFPREKVCGDCLNPACWAVLDRLGVTERVRALPHAKLARVEFIAIRGRKLLVDLPPDERCELAIKRSLFDSILLQRAGELGATCYEKTTVTALVNSSGWKIQAAETDSFVARVLVAADGRNSTVARLCNLLPRPERERVALQSHLPLPDNFRKRVVLQLLPHGYAGLSPVSNEELNVCLVAEPRNISALKTWAINRFHVSPKHSWRTITPLTRAPIPPAHENLFLIGDAARVVEPFTGEGIYYAMRSGELAANAIVKMIRGEDRQAAVREFTCSYSAMYGGRLWINQLARSAVLSPQIASFLLPFAPFSGLMMRKLTNKITR